MRRSVVSLLLIAFAGCRADSAEERLRRYFAVPAAVASDTIALGTAILDQLQRGTPEAEVASLLHARGVGTDSLSQYYPPTGNDTALVRVEYDPHGTTVVTKSYAVHLAFDSTRKLSGVTVTQWLTGP
jgi:hypothetical protein